MHHCSSRLLLLALGLLALAVGCGEDGGTGNDAPAKAPPDSHDACIQRLSGDWWASPMGDVRFDFENQKYLRLGNGAAGIQTLGVRSCETDRAVLLIDGCERLVEFEEGDVARIWQGPDPKSTVGLLRLRDDDGHLELAAPYTPAPKRPTDRSDGGLDDELLREFEMINHKAMIGDFPDPEKTEQLERACGDDVPVACVALGRVWRERGQREGYSEGHGLDVKSRKYLQKACDLGQAGACAEVIWITRHGDGTASRAFADRACALGDEKGCEMAASYRHFGYGGPIEQTPSAASPDGGK